jgi:hypothetical protein
MEEEEQGKGKQRGWSRETHTKTNRTAPVFRPRDANLIFPSPIQHRRQNGRRQLKDGSLDSVAPSPSFLFFLRFVFRG